MFDDKLDAAWKQVNDAWIAMMKYLASVDAQTPDLKVVVRAGHIAITGDYNSLTINGRRVRLQEKKK